MVSSIAGMIEPDNFEIIERGLFTEWPQRAPVHREFLPFGNVICGKKFDGLVDIEKVDDGIALTHRVDGTYKGLWPHNSPSEYMTDETRRLITHTDDFDGYQISDDRPGELVLLRGNVEVPHELDGLGLVIAIDFAKFRLCEKLKEQLDEFRVSS